MGAASWEWQTFDPLSTPALQQALAVSAGLLMCTAGSRLYLGVHSVPDLIGGTLLGFLLIAAACWALARAARAR